MFLCSCSSLASLCLAAFVQTGRFLRPLLGGSGCFHPCLLFALLPGFASCVSNPLDTCVPGFILGTLQSVPPIGLKSLGLVAPQCFSGASAPTPPLPVAQTSFGRSGPLLTAASYGLPALWIPHLLFLQPFISPSRGLSHADSSCDPGFPALPELLLAAPGPRPQPRLGRSSPGPEVLTPVLPLPLNS